MKDFIERWNTLEPREKRIVQRLVVEERTGLYTAIEEHMSSGRLDQIWEAIRSKLGCSTKVKVAFEMGKIWSTICKEVKQ